MSMIYYKQALYMKKWLKGLILLTFSAPDALKGLFLGHEEHPGSIFYSIYRYFSPIVQPKIRVSRRFRPVPGRQTRPIQIKQNQIRTSPT